MKQLTGATLIVEASHIAAYAKLTDDFNPIHLDPEFAAATLMGGVIAHGTLSICLLWQAIFASLGKSAGAVELNVRFVKPVRLGETLHAGGELSADDPNTYHVWVRGNDGSDRLNGTLVTAAAAIAAESA